MAKKQKRPIDLQKARERRDQLIYTELKACLTRICEQPPWFHLGPEDFLVYISQDRQQLAMAHFPSGPMGREMRIYPTLQDYCKAMEGTTDRERQRGAIEAEYWGFCLARRTELSEEELAVLDRHRMQLENGLYLLPFRKRPFRTRQLPAGEQLLGLLDCLGNFQMELEALIQYHVTPRFEEGEVLVRLYNKKTGLWDNFPAPSIPFPAPERHRIVFKKASAAVQSLLERPASEAAPRVELDYGWLTEPVPEEHGGCGWYPAVVALSNRLTKEPIFMLQCRPEELTQTVLTAVRRLVEEYGKPETLYVCRTGAEDIAADLAQAIGIPLKRVKRLPGAERSLRGAGAV